VCVCINVFGDVMHRCNETIPKPLKCSI